MPRGGLISVRCVPAAVTAQAVCVLFIFLASSLSSLQSLTASKLPLSRDPRNDTGARFSLAEEKGARAGAPGGGGSATRPVVLAAAAATSGKSAPAPTPGGKTTGEAKPAGPVDKKEEVPSPPAPSKVEGDAAKKTATESPTTKPAASPASAPASEPSGSAPAAAGKEGATGPEAGKPKETTAAPASSTSPAGSTGQAPSQTHGPGPVAPSPRATQKAAEAGGGAGVGGGGGEGGGGGSSDGSSTPTPGGSGAAHGLRAPVSATLALVVFGCALTIP